MREIGGKKGRGGWESYSVYMQRVYRDVYCVCTQKMTCRDGLSVKSLLWAFCESVISDLCQHEADPQCLGLSESAVHEAKRIGVRRKNTIKLDC